MTEELFNQLYTTHNNAMLGYLRTKVRDQAEDIAQEAWRKVWSNRRKYDPSRPFAPWLFAIADRTAKDHLKKRRTTALGEYDPAAAEADQDILALDLVRDSLADLPDAHLVRERYGEGRSCRELAAEVGVSHTTIHQRSCRGLETLRDRMKKPGTIPGLRSRHSRPL